MELEERADLSGHTFGQRDELTGRPALCPQCTDETGRPGLCDHQRYGRRLVRFLLMPVHLEALMAAHYGPDKRAAANEIARQQREYQTLPPRHLCSCICPKEDLSRGFPPCLECRRLRENQKTQEPIEFGRSAHVEAPAPNATMLDLIAGYLAA